MHTQQLTNSLTPHQAVRCARRLSNGAVKSVRKAGDGGKKHRVEIGTFQKWQKDLDRELQTTSWLDCCQEIVGAKKVVVSLKCKVYTEFVDKIKLRKNFSDWWIVGASSACISNVQDHAHNENFLTTKICKHVYAKLRVVCCKFMLKSLAAAETLYLELLFSQRQ